MPNMLQEDAPKQPRSDQGVGRPGPKIVTLDMDMHRLPNRTEAASICNSELHETDAITENQDRPQRASVQLDVGRTCEPVAGEGCASDGSAQGSVPGDCSFVGERSSYTQGLNRQTSV